MQIQPIRQNQNNQQNFGIKALYKRGHKVQAQAALKTFIDSLSTTEKEALLAKMRQSGEKVSIEVTHYQDKPAQVYLRDSKNSPIILTISGDDSRPNLKVITAFLDRLPKSQPTTTPKRRLSVADQVKREFGIMA